MYKVFDKSLLTHVILGLSAHLEEKLVHVYQQILYKLLCFLMLVLGSQKSKSMHVGEVILSFEIKFEVHNKLFCQLDLIC